MELIFHLNRVNSSRTYGYVETEDRCYIISESTVKALDGDIVLFNIDEAKIISVIKRYEEMIIGVLQITSKVTLGITKRRMPYKKFVPNNKKFPSFKVATKIANKGRDLYGIIRIKNWENNSKYPEGTLERIIGPVGNYDAEVDYLKYRNNIKWKRFGLVKPQNEIKIERIESNRKDFTNYHTFSIDPCGCMDIDDALHFIEKDDKIEVGIHIADVSRKIEENTQLDKEIRHRGQSIYFPDKQINMLPDHLAQDECSLIEKKDRFVLSTILTFSKYTYDLEKFEFFKGIINNKKNFSYDEADNILTGNKNSWKNKIEGVYGFNFWNNILNKIYEFTYEITDYDEFDFHKLIEYYMVLTNNLVASFLTERIPKITIYRVFEGAFKNNDNDDGNTNRELDEAKKFSKLIKYEKAKYVIGNEKNTGHKDLKLNHYTHFTSPIRRYADILVHRLLLKTISGEKSPNYNNYLEEINKNVTNIKRAEREMERLYKIYNLYNSNDSIFDTHGYVINIEKNMVSIYIPELEIESNCKVFSNKIEKSITYTSDKKKLIISSEKGEFRLNLFDRVDIRVVISLFAPKFKNKILVQILKPDPNFFIL